MTTATLYSIPQEPGRWWALTMATIVHLALFTLLWIGIRWQNETPVTVEAEVWTPQSQEVAPQPQPDPVQEIKPEPRPAPVEPPKPEAAASVTDKPDIALEQKKRRKAEEKERLAKMAEKKEELRIATEKAAELAKKNKATAKTEKEATEKKRLQEAAEAKQLAKMREEEMRRISGSTGPANADDIAKSQSSGADPTYVQKLSDRIKNNTKFVVPPDLRGNPSVEFTVELFPDGSVKSIRKVHPSNLRDFDEAVERAIRDSSPFPRDKSGNAPSFTFSHKPKKE